MCSIPGLPTPGSNVSVLITRVNLNPLCVLVELWVNFDQERKASYEHLRKEIKFPREAFRELEGNPGDLCLVRVYETWYRARIVSKTKHSYNVFLIDEGRALSSTTSMLAWGHNEFFHLPPNLEFCVLSNVLPLSPENKWSPMALKFLQSLCGKVVMARVQDVLVHQRTFLLDIPCISKQMYEMGFAKKLTTEIFKQCVIRSLHSDSVATATATPSDPLLISSPRNDPPLVDLQMAKQQHYMYPELQTETVETVIVTEVTNPLRVFCQLKVFSQELKKLTEQITQLYDGRLAKGLARPETLGSPCAARGSDGKWYRSVLQQVFPSNEAVEVLQVDYGKKQLVLRENVRALAPEFFWMPVVTYVCSLHGVIDKGVGWTAGQVDYLRSLLLGKTVIAKFEYQSLSEGVHYVTLYGDGNVNINQLFGSKERCLLECDKSAGDYTYPRDAFAPPDKAEVETRGCPLSPTMQERKAPNNSIDVPADGLPLNSHHTAVVQHVTDPWEFWIQTDEYAVEFDQLMEDITELYGRPDCPEVVRAPTLGLYCAAKAQDEAYYRATVMEVSSTKVKVFFVDYGNSEMVDRGDVRVLPEKFQALPKLALLCRLAGVRPNGTSWDQPSTAFLTQAVADKVLDVLVTEKREGMHVVRVTDSNALGVKDVGTLMCSAGFAGKDEGRETPRAKMLLQSFFTSTPLNAGAIPFGIYKENGALQTPPSAEPMARENRTAFRECLFPIGSTLEVSVSYIESPNDFWCQLAHNLAHLRVLMQEIQSFYADSHFQTPLEAACVARHPDTGMWYRALVIQRHAGGAHVDVLFIDYGPTKTVALQELRRMSPLFLQLRGQAFRCRLHNPNDPASSPTEWSDRAVAQFRDFVDTAAADHVGLKCTVHAVMYNERKVLFNVVDLATPFESVCTRMLQSRATHTTPPPQRASAFRLDTYYYSAHGIKTGTEVQVKVTSVKGVDHFYCQLESNADTVEDLAVKVTDLCLQLQSSSVPRTFGTVCFAKYTDGQWYRGQIKSTKPSILVHFVDYGDTLKVDKSDLLPVPIEASEIMTVPVQAIECGLADVPGNVPGEVNSWFETAMTDRSLRALVVAKEPGGKLTVELYDGKTQVNCQIRDKFHVEMRGKQLSWRSREPTTTDRLPSPLPTAHTGKADMETQPAGRWVGSKPSPPNHGSTTKPPAAVAENTQRTRPPAAVPYRTPHQRSPPMRVHTSMANDHRQTEVNVKQERVSPPFKEPQQDIMSTSAAKEKETPRAEVEALPKLTDLPSKGITSGLKADVFVSHCDGPLSFFVQLVSEEDGVFFISEKLNEGRVGEAVDVRRLRPGDVACAEFPEDSSYYRAVVKEIHNDGTCLVEFIDFGNTAVVSCSKLCKLPQNILQLPRYGIQCLLSGFALSKEEALDSEMESIFKEEIGLNSDKALQCRFHKEVGSIWEVSLEISGKKITCKASAHSVLSASNDAPSEKPEPAENEGKVSVGGSTSTAVPPDSPPLTTSLRYRRDNITEGNALEAYVSTFTGTPSFWCQLINTAELDEVTARVAEVGANADHRAVDAGALSPGSPCVALFTDDGQWYRAEVTSKDGDGLVVLYVDYGNSSRVEVKDVREMPRELMKTPPQAFLCRLDGFDVSHGSWAEGTAGRLSELLTDKLLILSVFRTPVEEEEGGRPVCYVSVDCEGEVINKKMKEYWRDLADKGQAQTSVDSPPCERLHCALTTKEEVAELGFERQVTPENSIFKEIDAAVAFLQSQKDFTGDDTARVPELQEESVHAQNLGGDCGAEDDFKLACSVPTTQHVLDSRHNTSNTEAIADLLDKNEKEQYGQPETEAAEAVTWETEPITNSLCGKLTNEVKKVESVSSVVVSEAEPIETGAIDPVPYNRNTTESRRSLSKVNPSSDDLYEEVVTRSSGVESQELERKEDAPQVEEEEPLTPAGDTEGPAVEEQGVKEEEYDTSIVLESEFGRLLSAADKLPVGSPCVVFSPTVSAWCKAKVLKNFEDCTQVLLVDLDTEMVVDPVNMFEVVLSDADQYEEGVSIEFETASSQEDSQDDHDEDTTSDSEDTVTADGPIRMEELVSDEELCESATVDPHRTAGEFAQPLSDGRLAFSCEICPAAVCIEQEVKTETSYEVEELCDPELMKDVLQLWEESINGHVVDCMEVSTCQAPEDLDAFTGQTVPESPVHNSSATENVVHLEEELPGFGEDTCVALMSMVMHLSLLVADNSEDSVVFVSETSHPHRQLEE